MKKCARALCAFLLCSGISFAVAAPGARLTPEQTFDLYAQALLEDDSSAARKLNDALKPVFDGKNALAPTPRLAAK